MLQNALEIDTLIVIRQVLKSEVLLSEILKYSRSIF